MQLFNPTLPANLSGYLTELHISLIEWNLERSEFELICQLTQLQSLSLSFMTMRPVEEAAHLEAITSGITALRHLRKLSLIVVPIDLLIPVAPELAQLTTLQHLELHSTADCVATLATLPSLQTLKLGGQEVHLTASLGTLTGLSSISFEGASLCGCLDALSTLTSLRSLECVRFDVAGGLAGFKQFHLALAQLTQLKSLHIEDGNLPFDMSCLRGFPRLESRQFWKMNLCHFLVPAGLISLRHMWIDATDGMPDMPTASALQTLTALSELSLKSTGASFQVVEPLAELCNALPKLESLILLSESKTGWSEASLQQLSSLRARMRLKQPEACNLRSLGYLWHEV